jgi:hypothetical protein
MSTGRSGSTYHNWQGGIVNGTSEGVLPTNWSEPLMTAHTWNATAELNAFGCASSPALDDPAAHSAAALFAFVSNAVGGLPISITTGFEDTLSFLP